MREKWLPGQESRKTPRFPPDDLPLPPQHVILSWCLLMSALLRASYLGSVCSIRQTSVCTQMHSHVCQPVLKQGVR